MSAMETYTQTCLSLAGHEGEGGGEKARKVIWEGDSYRQATCMRAERAASEWMGRLQPGRIPLSRVHLQDMSTSR